MKRTIVCWVVISYRLYKLTVCWILTFFQIVPDLSSTCCYLSKSINVVFHLTNVRVKLKTPNNITLEQNVHLVTSEIGQD